MPVLLRSPRPKQLNQRQRLAKEFLTGCGLEIGASASPIHVPHAEVLYYDCYDQETLSEIYPERADDLVALDGIENIENLSGIDDNSQDFIIACQVLEYCTNPLAAFHALARVLKPHGILYLSVVDKRHTEDRHCPVTPLGHLAADFVHGPACHGHSARQHLWTPTSWLELLTHIQPGLGFELEALRIANHEMLTVLRKA